MDASQSDMDYYEFDFSEDQSLKLRKFAKSRSLSTINEEASEASESGRSLASSKGSGFIDHKHRASKMTSKRKRRLFQRKDDDMELDLPSSGSFDEKPPPKDQTQLHDAPGNREKKESNFEQEICSKTSKTPRTPLRDRNQQDMPSKLTLKTESSVGNCEPAFPLINANDQFDKLFVSGIFNSVKPVPPTNKELQTMYINNSSDDDDLATPKKRVKPSPLGKKKVQSKSQVKSE